jgi:hypothetical protein
MTRAMLLANVVEAAERNAVALAAKHPLYPHLSGDAR